MNYESRNGVINMINNAYMNSSIMFAAAWRPRLQLPLNRRQEQLQWCDRQLTCRNSITLSFHMNPGSIFSIVMATSTFGGIMTHTATFLLTSLYCPFPWSDMGCHWMHTSITSYSHCWHYEQLPLHF